MGLALWIGAATPGTPAPAGESLTLQIRRAAVAEMLAAATPYRVEVGGGLLKETLTFSDPRELAFSAGKISFAIRCQGAPFPVDQVLRPVLTVQRAGPGYRLVVESLPLTIPGFGKVDLKDLIAPVQLESLLRQNLLLQGRPAQLDIRVERIEVGREAIEVGGRLTLTPAPSR